MKVSVDAVCGKEVRQGETECVSMKGLFIDCENSFSVGTECVFTLYIDGREGSLRVETRGCITFVNEDGMAAQFSSHLGLNSYDHLHKLVLYNADTEADQVEEEIESHLHHSV